MGPGHDVDRVELDYPDPVDDPAQVTDVDLSGGAWLGKTLGCQGNATGLIDGELAHGSGRVERGPVNLSLASPTGDPPLLVTRDGRALERNPQTRGLEGSRDPGAGSLGGDWASPRRSPPPRSGGPRFRLRRKWQRAGADHRPRPGRVRRCSGVVDGDRRRMGPLRTDLIRRPRHCRRRHHGRGRLDAGRQDGFSVRRREDPGPRSSREPSWSDARTGSGPSRPRSASSWRAGRSNWREPTDG